MGYFQSEQTEECGGLAGDMDQRSKQAETARLRNELTGALIGLARATDGNEHLISASVTAVILEGLAATQAGADSDDAALEKLLERVEAEKRKMVPNCFSCASPCGRTSDYDMDRLRGAEADIRNLKILILSGIREAAASICRGAVQQDQRDAIDPVFYNALIVIGMEEYPMEGLLPIALEVGDVNFRRMESSRAMGTTEE